MNELLERISVDPEICHGKPCVKGTRIMVAQVVQFLANGESVEAILNAYPSTSGPDAGVQAGREPFDFAEAYSWPRDTTTRPSTTNLCGARPVMLRFGR